MTHHTQRTPKGMFKKIGASSKRQVRKASGESETTPAAYQRPLAGSILCLDEDILPGLYL